MRKTHAEPAMREASLASRRACTMPQLSGPIAVQTLCDYKDRVDAYTGVLYCNFSCQIHSMILYSHRCQAIYYWTLATLLRSVQASQCPHTYSLDLLGPTLTPRVVGNTGSTIIIRPCASSVQCCGWVRVLARKPSLLRIIRLSTHIDQPERQLHSYMTL